MDNAEYRVQVDGIAAAFRSEVLVEQILKHPGGIAVGVMQWSGWPQEPGEIGWYLVQDAASASRFAAAVEGLPRASLGESTAIGSALIGATEALAANGIAGFRQVIDLSGDGRSNGGPEPVAGRGWAMQAGITVNGLAIRADDRGLDGYFRRFVAGGPGAFVAAIDGYEDFPAAIAAKLLRELGAAPAVGAAPAAQGPG